MAERSYAVRLRAEVDQFRKDMAGAAKAVGSVADAATSAGQQAKAMRMLGQAGKDVGTTLVAVSGAAAAGMVALGVQTIRTGVAYNTLEQTTRASLATLMGSTEAAERQMDKLREFVETRLFPREVFIEAQQMMLSFGFSAERVIPILGTLEDGIAATGGSAQTFSEVVEILSRVQSTGQVTAETMNELGRRGINAAELIGQAMGMTENEIRESITSGALDGREAIEQLVTAMETRFAGGAEALTTTWVGASGLVAAGLRNIGSAAVEAFIDPRGGGAAVEWANATAEALYAVNRALRPLIDELRLRADPAFARVADRIESVAGRIDQLDLVALLDQVRPAAPAFAALAAGISAAGGAALLSGVPALGALAGAINPVSAGILTAVAVSPELRDLMFELAEAIAPLVPLLLETAVTLGSALSTGVGALAEALMPLIPLIEDLVWGFMQLPDGVQQASVALGALALVMTRLPTPIGATVTALAALGVVMETFGVESVGAQINAQDLAVDLERLGRSGKVSGELMRLFGEDSEYFADRLDHAGTLANNRFAQFSNLTMKLGTDLGLVNNNLQDSADRFEALDEGLAAAVRSGEDADEVLQAVADTYNLSEEQLDQLLELLPEYSREAERQADRNGDLAESQDGVTAAVEETTAALTEQRDEMRAQADPVFALHRALGQVRDAQDAYNEAIDEHGENSDEAASAAIDLFEATMNLQGAAAEAGGAFDGELTPAMRATLAAAGLTEDQIEAVEDAFRDAAEAGEDYADTYDAEVRLHGADEAEAAARRVRDRLRQIDRFIDIHFNVTGQAPTGSVSVPMATGGPVAGPGGIDRVPAMLTRDEHVWTVDEVRAAGGHANVEALRAAVLAGATRFAAGGPVGVPRMQTGGAVVGADGGSLGVFEGDLVLDSGEYLGHVRGVVRQEISGHDRQLSRRVRQGTGAAR